LRKIIRDDQEGYVVRFSNGFRMKVKGERYLELHRVYSGISSRMVWENLSQSKSFDDVLAIVPDEFADWVRHEVREQLLAFDALNARVEKAYVEAKKLDTRKEQALMICEFYADVRGVVFAALDGKPTAPLLWKQLYPEFRRPGRVAAIVNG
jgi:RNA ligase